MKEEPRFEELVRPEGWDNSEAIRTFLNRDGDPLRAALLESLSHKDLGDVTADLLEFHLERARPWADQYPEQVFRRFLLCPLVADERLTDWSAPPPGPVGEVIALRKAGVPAWLRPLDGAVMLWRNGKVIPKVPEKCGKAVFRKTAEDQFLYRQNWSLERWTGTAWKPLKLTDRGWHRNELTARLPVGRYRVLTVRRLPHGEPLTGRLEFTMEPEKEREIFLDLPEEPTAGTP